MSKWVTVNVRPDTRKSLKEMKENCETYDQLVLRLMERGDEELNED
jgi:hypothetical protein